MSFLAVDPSQDPSRAFADPFEGHLEDTALITRIPIEELQRIGRGEHGVSLEEFLQIVLPERLDRAEEVLEEVRQTMPERKELVLPAKFEHYRPKCRNTCICERCREDRGARLRDARIDIFDGSAKAFCKASQISERRLQAIERGEAELTASEQVRWFGTLVMYEAHKYDDEPFLKKLHLLSVKAVAPLPEELLHLLLGHLFADASWEQFELLNGKVAKLRAWLRVRAATAALQSLRPDGSASEGGGGR